MSSAARVFLCLLSAWFVTATAWAQTPDNVLVVVNEESPASIEIGEYYARARAVPAEQVARIKTSTDETVSLEDYSRTIERPLAEWIAKRGLHDRILYIVLTKGVPIRIRGTGGREGTVSSVDSELTLLYRKLVGLPTSLIGRQDNPYFLGNRPIAQATRFTRFDSDIYLVTRLDGFTVADVIGLIERARAPVREGRFVFDQRTNFVDSGGDRWLGLAAERLQDAGRGVLLEKTREIASVDDPVLGYYSWGSNDASYRRRGPGLAFAPGALAGWFVSTDGRTFVEPPADWVPGPSTKPPGMFGSGSQSIAADLIREGVTGMSAHVDEPYLDGTARPQVLFPAYTAGFNLAEAYYLSIPFLSWQNVVIGDPLCAPFRDAPLAASQIDKGIDQETELPALFAERLLAVISRPNLKREALRLVMKASARTSRDDAAGAEEILRQAVETDPGLIGVSLQLATTYESRAEYDRAIAEYRRILKADANHVIALNNLAFSLAVRKNELDEALEHAKNAFSGSQVPTIADTLGWIHYLRGDHAAARPLLERAVAGAPEVAEIQLHAAFLHAALGQTTKARAELEAALTLDPSLAERDDVKELRGRIGGAEGDS